MRKHLLLTITLCAAPIPTLAQADAALGAIRVRQHLVLSYGKKIDFAVDTLGRQEQFRELGPGHLFSARSSLNVLLKFLNPVEYEWSLSTKSSAEPLVDGVKRFLSFAGSLPGLEATAAAPVPGTSFGHDPNPFKATTFSARETPLKDFSDPSLIEWDMWIETYPNCSLDNLRAEGRTDAEALDGFLHGTERSRSSDMITAAEFAGTLADAVTELKRAVKMDELRNAANEVASEGQRLKQGLKSAGGTATRLEAAALALANRQNADTSRICRLLPLYSARVISAVAGRVRETIARREAVVEALLAMEGQIRNLLPQHESDINGFPLGEVKTVPGERTTVTVTITKRNVTVSDATIQVKPGESRTFSFDVMQHQSLVTELKPGIAFSPVVFPRFKTNATGGQHIVAEAEQYRPNTIPMEMLNLMPNTGWSGFTRLVGQVGIGITKEAAVLLAGGGIRFSAPTTFVITAGALFPYIQRLKDGFNVGDAVAGEADLTGKIERVLSRKASFYIAIQR